MTLEKTLVTAEDLFNSCSDRRAELIDGRVVEMAPAGARHNEVEGYLTALLVVHARANRAGVVLPGDTGVILARNPDRVRAPDICFIAANRLPAEGTPRGYLELVPDLIVEVVSPGDTAEEVRQKTDEWLRAGARLVWNIYPDAKSIEVIETPDRLRMLHEGDSLDGGAVLPDFSAPVSAIFG